MIVIDYANTFYLNAIAVAIFIIGAMLSLKFVNSRKNIGYAFISLGAIEAVIYSVHMMGLSLLQRPIEFHFTAYLFTIGLITIFGGVLLLSKIKSRWMIFLILVAILQFIWTITNYY